MQIRYGKQNMMPAKRIVPAILALAVLLLAIAIMAAWMLIGYRQSQPPKPEESTDDTSQYAEPLTAVESSLIIFDFEQSTRFVLVQTDPVNSVIRVVGVPANLADKEGNTLSAVLEKHGSLQVTQAVSAVLELSVKHYITWSADGAQAFLNELSGGIVFTLPENIHYTDENGSTIRLNSGEQKLTGAQAAAVLQYQAWNDPANAQTVAPLMISAVLNQYMVPQQSLDGYFAALADTAQTDLRIDNYNGFRRVLTHLADNNTGALCRCITLIGAEKDGLFIADLPAMKKTELYP